MSAANKQRVLPEDLTNGFQNLGLRAGDHTVLHANLSKVGIVEGGAAMVLHRLLNLLGKKGTLLMPTFTSITRHSSTHDDFTKPGCWCGGKETRHLPFIRELQPDHEIGEVAHRLCSWPASRRSNHPAFSYVAVGEKADSLVRTYWLSDPVQPLSIFLKDDPRIVTIGEELDSVVAIRIAETRRAAREHVKERALMMGAKGPIWVEIVALGCTRGFRNLTKDVEARPIREVQIGSARASLYSMRKLIAAASRAINEDLAALACGRPVCLSCYTQPQSE